jgi:hypothetical protein
MPKLKPGTIWLTKAEEVRKQCQSLKGDLVEVDALRFTEEAATHVEGWSQRNTFILATNRPPWRFAPPLQGRGIGRWE